MLEMISFLCRTRFSGLRRKICKRIRVRFAYLGTEWFVRVRIILCLLLRTRVKHKVFCEGRCSKEEVGILASLLKVELE